MSTTTTKTCPKCGADAIHKHHDMHNNTHKAVHVGTHMLHGAVPGGPAGLIVVASLWGISKLINLASHTWKCSNQKCRHEFS